MRFQTLAATALFAQTALSANTFKRHTGARHNPYITSRDLSTTYNSTTDYDFVIVGAGPGGGATAANLAKGGFKVLLIDAGGDHGDELIESIPAMNLASTEYHGLEWAYYVHKYSDLELEKRDSKMVYNTTEGQLWSSYNSTDHDYTPPEGAEPMGIYYPRAGGLGGCAQHNAMFTMQAFDSDWERMAELTGDDSWAPEKMREYQTRIEKVNYFPHAEDHGTNGWFDISVTSLLTAATDLKIVSVLAGACSAFGKTIVGEVLATAEFLASVLVSDINAPGQLLVPEVYQVPLSMRDSKRGGVRDLIVEVAHAVNSDGSRKYQLDILLNTLVTKVNFDQSSETPAATGVEYLSGEALYRADPRSASASPEGSGTISASKEVIVAGGAYNTPQILKLSGVGPKEELQEFGIPVVVDLPGVGTNLQDRYEETVVSHTPNSFALTKDCTWQPDASDPCTKKWLEGKTQTEKGGYASNGIAISVIRNTTTARYGEPDIMVLGGPANFTGYYPGWSSGAVKDANHWAWIILKAHNRNRAGTVKLQSADPRDMPVINFNKFENEADAEEDLTAIVEGFEYARKIMDSVLPVGALSVEELLNGSFEEVWPGRDVGSDEDLKQFIKDETWGHHASCTCPIGSDDDPMAVLDGDFNVRGVKGLRVVDLSAFPLIPGFFPIMPLQQIAEKASDVIIAKYS